MFPVRPCFSSHPSAEHKDIGECSAPLYIVTQSNILYKELSLASASRRSDQTNHGEWRGRSSGLNLLKDHQHFNLSAHTIRQTGEVEVKYKVSKERLKVFGNIHLKVSIELSKVCIFACWLTLENWQAAKAGLTFNWHELSCMETGTDWHAWVSWSNFQFFIKFPDIWEISVAHYTKSCLVFMLCWSVSSSSRVTVLCTQLTGYMKLYGLTATPLTIIFSRGTTRLHPMF